MLYPNHGKMRSKIDRCCNPKSVNTGITCYKEFQEWRCCCFSWPEERCVRGSIIGLLGHHMGSADPRGPSSANLSSASLRNSASMPLHEELHKAPRDLYIHENNCWRWLPQFQPNINIKENKNMIKVNFNRDSK